MDHDQLHNAGNFESKLTTVLPHPRVDGRYLVVASETVLPPYCVKTNQPVEESDVKRKEFHWCSPWVGLWILISGLILIIAYFIVRKKCRLAYGLQPNLQIKYRRRKLLKILAVIILFFAMPFSASADSTPIMLTVCILFIVAVVSLFFGNSPLQVHKYNNGLFWIRGFSKDYLNRINSGSISREQVPDNTG